MELRPKKMYGQEGWEYTVGEGYGKVTGWSSSRVRAEQQARAYEQRFGTNNSRNYAEQHRLEAANARKGKGWT